MRERERSLQRSHKKLAADIKPKLRESVRGSKAKGETLEGLMWQAKWMFCGLMTGGVSHCLAEGVLWHLGRS